MQVFAFLPNSVSRLRAAMRLLTSPACEEASITNTSLRLMALCRGHRSTRTARQEPPPLRVGHTHDGARVCPTAHFVSSTKPACALSQKGDVGVLFDQSPGGVTPRPTRRTNSGPGQRCLPAE
uniref:Uncharacterized protein n=1 Tax=Leishmania guyanensis TaxID=5670 RepID=A0A1E1IWV6_LEIGU|nr:Hypothetical protein BN36_2333010 [Leishmania guyanensis]